MVPLFESKDIPGLGLIIQRRAQVPLGGPESIGMTGRNESECAPIRT